MSTSEALASRKQLGRFMLVMIAIALTLGVMRLVEYDSNLRATQHAKIHDEVMATTVDASGDTGLVRIRQLVTRTQDGACTITIQRYERNSINDLFLKNPHIETFPCSGTTM